MTRPLELQLDLKIHAYDVDAMGFVSNIVYIRWFEDMRTNFLEVYYPFRDMIKANQSPVLAHTEVDYKLGLTIHNKIIGQSWVNQMGPLKWDMSFEIVSESGIHCIGRQHGYYIDIHKKRPVKIPEPLVDAFEQAT